jgi:outer membrane protein assembly factor BamB
VVLGLGDGRLLEELLAQSKLRVIGVDADARKVNVLRDKLVAAGLYGGRAEVFVGEPFSFPLPPYIASLIVSGDLASAEFPMDTPAEKIFNCLRPYGGVACLRLPAEKQDAFAAWAAAGKLQNAELGRSGGFAMLRRAGPLPGSADWTHETGDPARSFCSKDQLVQAPLGVLWYGDGPDYGFYKEHDYEVGVKPQAAGGWLFAYRISSRTLQAIDVYTGRHLWKQQVEHFTRYASLEDGVYVASKDRCVVYDPATGAPRATFTYDLKDEKGRAPDVSDIRVSDDIILIAATFGKLRAIENGLWDSAVLVALDRRDGKELWRRQAKDRFNNNAIAIAEGMVFCTDSASPARNSELARRGAEAPKTMSSTILALDARTGELRWQQTVTQPLQTTGGLGIMSYDDWLAYAEQPRLLLTGKMKQLRAFEPGTGRMIWQKEIGGGQPMILRGDTFITQGGHVFDTRTGQPLSKTPFWGKRGGCNYAVGGEHLLFVRDFTACYIDVETGTKYRLGNVRSGCSNSFVAADGVLNCPCFSVGCVCNYPLQTSFAMSPMPEVAPWAGNLPVPVR